MKAFCFLNETVTTALLTSELQTAVLEEKVSYLVANVANK